MTEKTDDPACADIELVQCEAEVRTLLQIISDLNVKMGSLQIPSDQEKCSTLNLTSSPPTLQTEALTPCGKACGKASKTKSDRQPEGRSVALWNKLQEVLASLEASACRGRMLVAPNIPDDERTPAEHITAARESWVQATQVLEDLEQELGISYPSALPIEERRKYQKEILMLNKVKCKLKASLQSGNEELHDTQKVIEDMDEEKKRLQEKLDDLKSKWLIAATCSPPRSPSLSSSRSTSPSWFSPVIPGSPLLSGRMPISPPDSPSRPSRPTSVLATETERLQRCQERLKARNERLTAALERRKSESEQISMVLSRHEADCSALHMALTYCEECEEAYCELLSMYEARKHPNTRLAEASIKQAAGLIPADDESPSMAQHAEAVQKSLSAEEFEDKTGVLQQRIVRLRQDRSAVCIPEQTKTGEGQLSPDTGTLAGTRRFSSSSSNDPKAEKAALHYELANVRDEMSDLRRLIRLRERERRCLELSLSVQKCQDLAGVAMAQSLRDELEDRRAEQQRIDENCAKLEDRVGVPGPRNRAISKELQAVQLREQKLRRNVTLLRESLESALADCTTHSRVTKQEVTHLLLCHRKAMTVCRNARKKHQQQLWRLEREVMVMQEHHAAQLSQLKDTLEVLEWKKEEETVL